MAMLARIRDSRFPGVALACLLVLLFSSVAIAVQGERGAFHDDEVL